MTVVAPARATVVLTLIALSSTAILALTGLLLLEVGGPLVTVLQAILLVTFMALALIDLRSAVAIAMLELAIAGASGQWTRFPGGLSGRVILDMTVAFAGAVWLLRDWRRNGRLELGRYAPHAIAIAFILPIVWMPLGIANGNRISDVIADGNAHLFFAFSLACLPLMRQGHGAWLRRWFFIACIANALVTFALIAVSVPGIVPLQPTLQDILHHKLLAGNVIGYQPNGAYRLYLASGLYLQLGLALTTWRLLRRPRSLVYWTLYGVLWVDVLATYTRGLWIGSIAAIGLLLLIGARSWRPPATVMAGSAALFMLAIVVTTPFGFSLTDYVSQRAGSITQTEVKPPPQPTQSEASGQPEPSGTSEDTSGALSNEVRLVQAKVLIGHIAERPLLGYGFGSIARDYPYGQIYSYEIAYLDLLYKTGVVGLLVFLSFPARLLIDAVRGRIGQIALPSGVSSREMAVVVAIVASIGLTGATNPYFLAAFGLMPVILMIAWLDPVTHTEER